MIDDRLSNVDKTNSYNNDNVLNLYKEFLFNLKFQVKVWLWICEVIESTDQNIK